MTTGSAIQNVGIGTSTLAGLTSGAGLVAVGYQAGTANSSGSNSVFVGFQAGKTFSTASECVAIGRSALAAANNAGCTAVGSEALTLCTGDNNTALGRQAGNALTSGTGNLLLGVLAGANYSSTEANNIAIGAAGTAGESNWLRIGTQGTGTRQQNTCAIAGITGSTSTLGVAVLVNSTGVMGTITSSEKFKDNIRDMGTDSAPIFGLRPVTFTYKPSIHVSQDESTIKQYGLIAEETLKVMPDLVSYDLEGNVDTVKYNNLIPMLLNELKNLKADLDRIKGA